MSPHPACLPSPPPLRPHPQEPSGLEVAPRSGGAESPRETIEDRPGRGDRRSIRWAVLLARIYDVLPLLRAACGGEMRILAFLTDPPVIASRTAPCPTVCGRRPWLPHAVRMMLAIDPLNR